MELSSNNETPSAIPNPDFEKTVAESRQKLHNETQKTVRKGRSDKGRSRKTNDANGSNAAGTPVFTQSPQSSPQTGPAAPLDISPYLAMPIEMLSKVPARKHKLPELALTKEEALDCAKSINEVFKAFVPNIEQMSPKTAAIVNCGVILGMTFVMKYQILAEHQAKQRAELKPVAPGEDKEELNPPEIPLQKGAISADNYFGRSN